MKVAVIDYGICNLGSVTRALVEVGAEASVVLRPAQLASADCIVLPGVGSFSDGMANLRVGGWTEAIREQVLDLGKPLLGICLGMQLLATTGSEGGEIEGLDIIPGKVVRLDQMGCKLRIPHVGWNTIALTRNSEQVFSGIPIGTDFYFVHSYAFCPTYSEHVLAWTEYGISIAAAVGSGHIVGTQFHPEKSSKAGFRVLANFLRVKAC